MQHEGCPKHGHTNYQYPMKWEHLESVECECLVRDEDGNKCGQIWHEPNPHYAEELAANAREEYYNRFR